jgi:hypothetical protein
MGNLLALIRADQRSQWEAGNRVLVESYLVRHPNLLSCEDMILDLICSEILLREDLGDVVTADEYACRFPQYQTQVRRQMELHSLVRSGLISRSNELHVAAAESPRTGETAPQVESSLETIDVVTIPSVPGYEIIGNLGCGGRGIVFKARQRSLDRVVALKMLRDSESFSGREGVAHVLREAKAVAELKHPNIVQVFDCGEHAGRPYFSMEYVEGGSLKDRLIAGPLQAVSTAELVETLARAMHHAHQKNIVHRDLKPANILLTIDGSPKVADFGLAKHQGGEASPAPDGAIVGTACYMAPEQAAGRTEGVGPTADVYALGAVLYECLTGRPPFRGASLLDTLEQVRSREPELPRRLQPKLSKDLQAVCLKCIEKDAENRYQTADLLATDLRNWLQGKATIARPQRWVKRACNNVCRHAWWAGLAVCLVLLLGAFVLTNRIEVFKAAIAIVNPTGAQVDQPQEAHQSEALNAEQMQSAEDLSLKLARGESVTLIGNLGYPYYATRWVTSERGSATSLERDDAFTISSFDTQLLELVHDPQQPRYRLRGEIRHMLATNGSFVGIYFLHEKRQVPTGELHYYYRLAFNDIVSDLDNFNLMKREGKLLNAPAPAGNRLYLQPIASCEVESRTLLSVPLSTKSNAVFDPARLGGGRWRSFVVEVSPDGVAMWWDGQHLGALTAEGLARDARNLDATVAIISKSDAWPDHVFTSRQSLGVFIDHGSASLRNFVIEPLMTGP